MNEKKLIQKSKRKTIRISKSKKGGAVFRTMPKKMVVQEIQALWNINEEKNVTINSLKKEVVQLKKRIEFLIEDNKHLIEDNKQAEGVTKLYEQENNKLLDENNKLLDENKRLSDENKGLRLLYT